MLFKLKKTFLIIGLLGFVLNSVAQKQTKNNSHGLQINAGTIHVYRTLTIGYETPTLFQLNNRHQFRLSINGGIWNSRFFNKNNGSMIKANALYLFGAKQHHFELSGGIATHFDKGLKGQLLTYIGVLPQYYLGYRYEKAEGGLFFKGGLGWYEFLQLGIGYRF